MIRRISFVIALAACGSKQATPAPPPPAADHHEEMAQMPPELAQFHDTLAPRWHAEKGPQRMKDTCAALPDFHAQADALAKITPPTTTHADTWATGTKELLAAVGGLDATCRANDAASFDAAFARVHASFHGLLAQGMTEGTNRDGDHSER